MSTQLATYTEDQVTDFLTAGFTRQSDRDKQSKIGPSEIGGCAYCVGHTLSQRLPNPPAKRGDEFGYAAWVGTMAHYWLEQNLQIMEDFTDAMPFDSLREHRVEVADLEGYGTISGSLDLYVPAFKRTFDWKFPGKWSYDNLKLRLRKGLGPSNQYRFQQQLYAHGLIRQGHEVEYCRLVFLPRHSNNVQDVIHWEEPYNPAMVELVLARTEAIWDDVKEGLLDEIASDEGCYTCTTYGR